MIYKVIDNDNNIIENAIVFQDGSIWLYDRDKLKKLDASKYNIQIKIGYKYLDEYDVISNCQVYFDKTQ